jgi:hypothetical protein
MLCVVSFGSAQISGIVVSSTASSQPGAFVISVDVVVSTAGGILATLAGVLAGGVVTNRAQTQQWLRGEQVRACADVLRESTKVLLELERARRKNRKQDVDWGPWNEALATTSVVAEQAVVDAAVRLDECFWPSSKKVDSLNVTDDEWRAMQDDIESRRLEFINTSRRVLRRSGPPLKQIVGRPSEWKWQEPATSMPAEGTSEHSD